MFFLLLFGFSVLWDFMAEISNPLWDSVLEQTFHFRGTQSLTVPATPPHSRSMLMWWCPLNFRCGNAETIVGGKDSDPSLWGAPFFGTQKKVMGIEWHQHLPGLVMTNSFAIENGDL